MADTVESSASAAVIDALYRVCSQEASVLKPAEAQLKQWETQPGFYSILTSVFLNKNLDVSVRWQAVLYFKNGIDRYWRRNAPGAIAEDEKDAMRHKLIESFDEPINQIAVQLAVLIGKIARLDCPRNWPQLIPTMLAAVQNNDPTQHMRALPTFYSVIKALASRRLPADRKIFEDLTSNIFTFLFEMWESYNRSLCENIQCKNGPASALCMNHAILCLKALRKLVVFGFADLDKSAPANEFMKVVFLRMDQFLRARAEFADAGQDLLCGREKIITLLTKVPLDVQEYHAEAFGPFIQSSLELTVLFVFTTQGLGLIDESFTVNMLNLMRNILRCESYKPAKSADEIKNPVTLAAYNVRKDFFSKQLLTEITRQLVLKFFPLTSEDLSCWQSDPENFTMVVQMCNEVVCLSLLDASCERSSARSIILRLIIIPARQRFHESDAVSDESGDSCKFSLRPCQEGLFLTLVKEFRDTVPSVVMELAKEFDMAVDADNLSAVLQKDAVYCAIGLASFDMYDFVDFDGWLSNTLLAELQLKHPNCRVIRRRIAWLIGCWVGVKLPQDRRPAIYQALIPLLQPSEDLVIRIEAAQTLKIDDFEFKADQFIPYLEVMFSLLFQLLQDVSKCETKMNVLHVMSFIIERMQAEIRPHTGPLVRYLPMLWDASVEYGMLRCAIVSTLSIIVQSLGAQCVDMYPILLPIIQHSTDVEHEPHVYLYEDGMELWLHTVQCSPSMTPHLLDLFGNVKAILEIGSETLKTSLKLVEAYVMLGGKEFLDRYGATLVASLTSLLKELKSEATVLVYKVVETVLKVCPEDGAKLFGSLLTVVVKAIVDGEEYPMVLSVQFSLLSRLALSTPALFCELIDVTAQQNNCQSRDLMGALLDRWFEKMDYITQAERKKLTAMALASMITSSSSCVLERFPDIINTCVEVLHDVTKTDADTGVQTDCLVITRGHDVTDDQLETEHDRRRYQLSLHDPVYIVKMHDFLISQLSSLRSQVGDSSFSSLMQSVDVEISQQLQHLLR